MLLTKIIPPRATEIKNAVTCFNNFIEEPHTNVAERCEMFIYGGRGCCKSSIAAGMMLKGIKELDAWGICIRKHGRDLKDSCFAQLEFTAKQLGIDDELCHSLSNPVQINYGCRAIRFYGLDNGLDWLHEKTVAIPARIVWIEEADQLESEEEYKRLLLALPLKENPIVISTFNPPLRKSHWINKCVEENRKKSPYNGKHFFEPCYLDMERDMLGEDFYREADMLRRENGWEYCHEYLGIPLED